MLSIAKLTTATLALVAALAASPHSAMAERLLRLDGSPPGQLDPNKAADDSGSILAFNLYDTLVIPNQGKPGVQPHIATEWTVDGDTYTFQLRPDVKFHSGNDLTADDVVYSFNRLMALGQGFSFLFQDLVKSVEADGPHTVKFTLNGPSAPFLASLVRVPILDSELVKSHSVEGKYGENGDYGDAWLSSNDAGSGAYMAVSHNPQDQTEMAKFPGYFLGVTEVSPDRVIQRYGIAPSTLRSLMASGEHEIGSPWTPPDVIKALAARDDMHLLTVRAGFMSFFQLNTKLPPLDDVHCRRALAYSIDYDTLLKMVQITPEVSQGLPANGPIGSDVAGYDPSLPNMKQDLDKAREELALCKYDPAEAPPIEITSNTDVPIQERFALLLNANFGELGFTTKTTKATWAELTQRMTNPDTTPGLFQLLGVPVTPDPDSLLYPTYYSKLPRTFLNSVNLEDAEIDSLLDQSRVEMDPDKRLAILQEIDRRLVDLMPTIVPYQFQAVFVASKRVNAPALQEDDKRFGLTTYNFVFRLFDVEDSAE